MSGLPALATAGNRIVRRDTGEAILLRGVNRSGLEYSQTAGTDFLAAAGITEAEVRHITAGWGANIIRLPFNQDWALHIEDYRRALDQVIEWAAALGAYTLLDLQWIDTKVKIAPLPDENSRKLWRILARRYRGNPAVLFDLYNEPHDVSAARWRYAAGLLIEAIRDEHPQALIFVSGLDWGYDLREVPLDTDGVVYSTHPYPWKKLAWSKAFGRLAEDLPVFAAEWGGREDHLLWGDDLAQYFRELGIGWTAWSWADDPHLMLGNEPTAFGELVRRELETPLILPT